MVSQLAQSPLQIANPEQHIWIIIDFSAVRRRINLMIIDQIYEKHYLLY